MRKSHILIALATVLVISSGVLFACSTPSTPTDSVTKALEALKAGDYETLSKYYSGDITILKDPEAALSQMGIPGFPDDGTFFESLGDEQKNTLATLKDKVLDFDFSVSNEKIDGDKATVLLTVDTYDFSKVFVDLPKDYVTVSISSIASGQEVGPAAFFDRVFEVINAKLNSLGEKDFSTTVTLSLTKSDNGTWMVDDLTGAANALTGGLVGSVQDLAGSIAGSVENNIGSLFGNRDEAAEASSKSE